MPPVMHRDEAILMLWINICEAYCHYLHNTTTRNRDCWLGKLRRETAQCWWRRRVESVWWSHSWEPRIKWRGGFLPRDVTTFAFIQRRLFPTISWVSEHDHLPHDNLTVSITLNNFNSECFGRKVKSFDAHASKCVWCPHTCDCEARHVDGLFREWWPSDDCFSDSRSTAALAKNLHRPHNAQINNHKNVWTKTNGINFIVYCLKSTLSRIK